MCTWGTKLQGAVLYELMISSSTFCETWLSNVSIDLRRAVVLISKIIPTAPRRKKWSKPGNILIVDVFGRAVVYHGHILKLRWEKMYVRFLHRACVGLNNNAQHLLRNLEKRRVEGNRPTRPGEPQIVDCAE